MRAILQRVTKASCKVAQEYSGKIEHGLLILLGVAEDDTEEDMQWLAQKIVNMRIFGDANGLMNLSVQEVNGDILLISQFTLLAATKKGNRPSFIRAAKPEKAQTLYLKMEKELQKLTQKTIQMGVFGADMKIELLNDGPVTIYIDSKNRE